MGKTRAQLTSVLDPIVRQIKEDMEKVRNLPSTHDDRLLLFRHCVLFPAMCFLLRTVHAPDMTTHLQVLDVVVKTALQDILVGVPLTPEDVVLLHLPCSQGGVVLRSHHMWHSLHMSDPSTNLLSYNNRYSTLTLWHRWRPTTHPGLQRLRSMLTPSTLRHTPRWSQLHPYVKKSTLNAGLLACRTAPCTFKPSIAGTVPRQLSSTILQRARRHAGMCFRPFPTPKRPSSLIRR